MIWTDGLRVCDFWFDQGVIEIAGLPKDSVMWRFQKVFVGMRGGLENFVTLPTKFVEGLEAMVIDGNEHDFLFWFRFGGLGFSYLVGA